jgi:hypothetical protein
MAGTVLRLSLPAASSVSYSDAQIDDYHGVPRRRFRWRPPLTLTVRARFSHEQDELVGTAGFGFWNDPFSLSPLRLPMLPRAVWFFFGSEPSNLKFDLSTPGYGWRAATIDARRPIVWPLLLISPALALLMQVPSFYERLWPSVQRAIRVQEALVDVRMRDWHTYTIEWGARRTHMLVDGVSVLDAESPGGPLAFVLWIDNQYMVATPRGRLSWGLLDVPEPQSLEVASLQLESAPKSC